MSMREKEMPMREKLESTPAVSRGPAPRLRRGTAAALLACLLAALAPLPASAGEAPQPVSDNDPLEPLNRLIFAFNETLDTFVLRPAALAYGNLAPAPARRGIRNVVRNLSLPFTFINDVAQGEWGRSGATLQRLVINTTVGLGGLNDIAADYGLPHRENDFGDTLAAWGVGEGPYLVLPLAGPSTVRDAAGFLVENAADPVDIAFRRHDLDDLSLGLQAASILDFRHRNMDMMDDFKASSLDYYAFIRTLYRQRRTFESGAGEEPRLEGADEAAEDDAYPPRRPDFRRGGKPAEIPRAG